MHAKQATVSLNARCQNGRHCLICGKQYSRLRRRAGSLVRKFSVSKQHVALDNHRTLARGRKLPSKDI